MVYAFWKYMAELGVSNNLGMLYFFVQKCTIVGTKNVFSFPHYIKFRSNVVKKMVDILKMPSEMELFKIVSLFFVSCRMVVGFTWKDFEN